MSLTELAGRFIAPGISQITRPITDELRAMQLAKLYPFLNGLPRDKRKSILMSLETGQALLPGFASSVNALFVPNGSNDMTTVSDDLAKAGCTDELQLFSCEPVTQLITVIAQMPDRHIYRRPLGAFFARMPITTISPEVATHTGIERSPATLSVTHKNPQGWFLCEGAESYLLDAISSKHYVIVNDSLFVKQDPHGHIAALCIQSLSSADGRAFFEGNWYCPVDHDTRTRIRKESGNVEFDTGVWAHIRELRDDTETGKTSGQILRMAQALA